MLSNHFSLIGGGHHGHGGFSFLGLDFGLITGLLLISFIILAVLSKLIKTEAASAKKWHQIGVYGATIVVLFHSIYNYIIHFKP